MTFQELFAAALTVKAAPSSEHIPEVSYYAGSFYSLSNAATQLPTVLSGGSITIEASFTLSFQPLDCRMLVYSQEGAGTLRLASGERELPTDSLLYLDRRELSFSLTASHSSWRIIIFSLGG